MTTRHTHLAAGPRATRTALSCVMLAVVPALLLVGCSGGDNDDGFSPPVASSNATTDQRVTDSANVDAAVEKTPCDLLTADMVARVFDVPAAELEQSQQMSSRCNYSRDDGDERLDVSFDVAGVFDDAKAASKRFRSVTKGLSGEEMQRAMAGIKADVADKLEDKPAGTRQAAEAVVESSSKGRSDGIRFEDVDGVGDEARLALTVGAGDLYVRAGNMNFTVAAYSGPAMPRPDKLTASSIMAADKQWRSETLPQRKEAAIKLANAVVESL